MFKAAPECVWIHDVIGRQLFSGFQKIVQKKSTTMLCISVIRTLAYIHNSHSLFSLLIRLDTDGGLLGLRVVLVSAL